MSYLLLLESSAFSEQCGVKAFALCTARAWSLWREKSTSEGHALGIVIIHIYQRITVAQLNLKLCPESKAKSKASRFLHIEVSQLIERRWCALKCCISSMHAFPDFDQ